MSIFVESEGPNKPNAGSNSAIASKAVRMKHRAQAIEMDEMLKSFPKDDDDSEDQLTITKMLQKSRRDNEEISERLQYQVSDEKQDRHSNQVCSLRAKMNSEMYFDPVGLGQDMDEHSGQPPKDHHARVTKVRNTMAPSSSKGSFQKNNSQPYLGPSQTPSTRIMSKKMSTPFL